MIHEIRPWMLQEDLSLFDIITFDDGLYSQYVNYKHFLKFDKPLIFFISSGIVCDENTEQNTEYLSCSDAHKCFFTNDDKSNYMKWSQIHEINQTEGCEIGGHGYKHIRFSNEKLKIIHIKLKEDIEFMQNEFSIHHLKPISFCFPYNEEYIFQRRLLQDEGYERFFGEERIAIEDIR